MKYIRQHRGYSYIKVISFARPTGKLDAPGPTVYFKCDNIIFYTEEKARAYMDAIINELENYPTW